MDFNADLLRAFAGAFAAHGPAATAAKMPIDPAALGFTPAEMLEFCAEIIKKFKPPEAHGDLAGKLALVELAVLGDTLAQNVNKLQLLKQQRDELKGVVEELAKEEWFEVPEALEMIFFRATQRRK